MKHVLEVSKYFTQVKKFQFSSQKIQNENVENDEKIKQIEENS